MHNLPSNGEIKQHTHTHTRQSVHKNGRDENTNNKLQGRGQAGWFEDKFKYIPSKHNCKWVTLMRKRGCTKDY